MITELSMSEIEQEARAIANRIVMGERDQDPQTPEQALLHQEVEREMFYVIVERLWRAHGEGVPHCGGETQDEAYRALVKTSCCLGHPESEQQILLWLSGVTDKGMESLAAKINAHRDDVRAIRASEVKTVSPHQP